MGNGVKEEEVEEEGRKEEQKVERTNGVTESRGVVEEETATEIKSNLAKTKPEKKAKISIEVQPTLCPSWLSC